MSKVNDNDNTGGCEGKMVRYSEFLAYAIIRRNSSDDRISEKLGVMDRLPFAPVCCQELAQQVERSVGEPDEIQV